MDSPQLLGKSDISEIITKNFLMENLNVQIIWDGLCLLKGKEDVQSLDAASQSERIRFVDQAHQVICKEDSMKFPCLP